MSQQIFERTLAVRRQHEAAIRSVAVDGCNPAWVCEHPVAEVTYPQFFNRIADDLVIEKSLTVKITVTRQMSIDRVIVAGKAKARADRKNVSVGDVVTVTIGAGTVKAIDGVPWVALVDDLDPEAAAHRTLQCRI